MLIELFSAKYGHRLELKKIIRGWRRGITVVQVIAVILCATISAADASQWCGFKGIYVGMSAAELKKKGVSNCTKSQVTDEKCKIDGTNKELNTFGGEPVQNLEAGIEKGKVSIIVVKTKGNFGGGLEKVMTGKYGKPAVKNGNWRNGAWRWDKGDEFIILQLGNGINEVTFAIDPTTADERVYKQKRKKAATDF